MVQLTSEQLKAAELGEAVKVEADGKTFVLLREDIYTDDLDYSPWSQQEIDDLAVEAIHLVTCNGPDDGDQLRMSRRTF